MNIIDNAKEIAGLIKKYNDQQLYERVVELREQIVQLREDNVKLKEKVKAMGDAQNTVRKLKRIGNCYKRTRT